MNPDAANAEYLVSTQWLASHIDAPSVRIFDVTGMLTVKLINRAQAEVFDKGHIPGSLFFDVAAILVAHNYWCSVAFFDNGQTSSRPTSGLIRPIASRSRSDKPPCSLVTSCFAKSAIKSGLDESAQSLCPI